MKYLAPLITAIILLSLSMCTPKKQTKKSYTDFDRGYSLWYYDKLDSAYVMFNRYLQHPDDTLKKAIAYKFMGEVQREFGDLYSAEENLLGAIKTLDSSNTRHHEELSYVYNDLGNINLDLKSYDAAINYYDRATRFAAKTDFIYEIMNGKATTFQKQKNYNAAIKIYDSVLSARPDKKDLLARVIDNRANTKWNQNPQYNALPEFWEALKIRSDSQYLSGQLASYDHLSDYYTTHDRDSAFWYASRMLSQSRKLKISEDILKAIQKLVILDDDLESKERLFREYTTLSDSIQFARNTAVNRFAVLKYDFQTVKEDNFSLKRLSNTLGLLTVIIVILSLFIITSLIVSFRRRRMRMRQEAELSIRNSKLKTSQRVHDVVANELYGIMNELEHGKPIEREPLLIRIEELYEKSRDISYEEPEPVHQTDYDKQIHNLLNDFISEQTEVFVVGNQPVFWDQVTNYQKTELLLMLKEIMTNMKKHSGAHNVVIRFRQEDRMGYIHYSDDGKGFPVDHQYGNGLKNTVNRIKSLNGAINFGKSDKGGASIAISFPLEP